MTSPRLTSPRPTPGAPATRAPLSIPLPVESNRVVYPVPRGEEAPRAADAADGQFGWRVAGKYLARGGRKVLPRGVTYGPFPPNTRGEPFPEPAAAAADLVAMRRLGFDSIRTYCLPPAWLLAAAEEHGIAVLLDVPWAKHLSFLDSARLKADARQAVAAAAAVGGRFQSVLAYSIGNEIPADIVRWHGARQVARFLGELADVVHQTDPRGLVTYANFPPTEYLEIPGLDFVTYNVYLHDREVFRRYILRLQHLVGDRPLVLGEMGMDTLRHGEAAQAAFLAGHLREADLLGVAGSFVFAWTDQWHTGGHLIEDWAFGITRADRAPKAACAALATVNAAPPARLMDAPPRVSVVVCSYNGGRTLDACLESLTQLDYPDVEVIVVDDGSTDDTRQILRRFPTVVAIHQPNLGLSAARNAGLRAASGAVIAYTDSDCVADRDWLSHLVHQLQTTGADAVGGPNIAPDDGWLVACINTSPGQPTHVLVSDQVAEHVPGCNMAFRREALEAIAGFDPRFRRAGDDVDLCWRLQESGRWITFSPGAMVWHHRRSHPRAYFRQQAGYGEAEALLRFKHPEQFNGQGRWKWRGVLYGASLQGLQMRRPLVYRGPFGTGLFQCIYQAPADHWVMMPSTLEWHVATAVVALNAILHPAAGWLAGAMLAASLLVALFQALQATLPVAHDSWRARLVVAALCHAQPLVRTWAHVRTRLSSYRAITGHPDTARSGGHWPWWQWLRHDDYWSATAVERTTLLERALETLRAAGWGVTPDSGWSDYDGDVFGHPWSRLRCTTSQEDHGSGRRLIRVRYRLTPTWLAWMVSLAVATTLALTVSWSPATAAAVGAVGLVALLGVHRAARHHAAAVADVFRREAERLCLIPCRQPRSRHAGHGGES